ncbi:Uu.00g127370.m01.CDS01 [Anthostomella pinea]|uniref:Uu.00g127370.m01.CDS01 n=1 Tax=Anthostomella pinea TaxID=933095 RepID=A0AAI8VI57_9PEZI|nr:Uu.00g127370.m01.CDS01 [Anthostomella pinea]
MSNTGISAETRGLHCLTEPQYESAETWLTVLLLRIMWACPTASPTGHDSDRYFEMGPSRGQKTYPRMEFFYW